MLDITKAIDKIEEEYKDQFLNGSKDLYDKNFYAALFGIAKELFGRRQNTMNYNFDRAKDTSYESSNKEIDVVSKTDETYILKILKNINYNDDELIKELESIDELLEHYQSNLQATDLILLQVAMEYLSFIYNLMSSNSINVNIF